MKNTTIIHTVETKVAIQNLQTEKGRRFSEVISPVLAKLHSFLLVHFLLLIRFLLSFYSYISTFKSKHPVHPNFHAIWTHEPKPVSALWKKTTHRADAAVCSSAVSKNACLLLPVASMLSFWLLLAWSTGVLPPIYLFCPLKLDTGMWWGTAGNGPPFTTSPTETVSFWLTNIDLRGLGNPSGSKKAERFSST